MRRLLSSLLALAAILVLSACAVLPVVPGEATAADASDDEQADARIRQIAEAVDSHDLNGLKALFSSRALEQARDLDGGLEYFLSFFADGDFTWERDSVGAETDVESGKTTELLDALYKVSSGGQDYWLVFKDFTTNDAVDPQNVGLNGLGIAAWSESPQDGRAGSLMDWAGSIHIDGTGPAGYPGVYVPESS